ncbi:hypothetical protein LOTGIDRAFT_165079 [Lottia gigantea]|uniref:C-type lectin domain-containing protein n=1 Tax=Lottia gigantea TaxID=225164 RepID=V3ZYM5_LOTGI|nr:hypothetical protein LOTGIDRAFT_165079 [Lottia gigantea]ESO89487.1 hypothetical protein LOTGIDRAFT_165079 [Lottia gigantea]
MRNSFLYVYWILLFHFILCEFPPMSQLTTTQVTDLCKKGGRGDQVLYRLGICYYRPPNQYGWQDAVKVCETRNTHIVHVETTEKQNFIMQNTGGTNFPREVWLGLKRTQEKNWAWFYKDKLYPALNPRWSTTSPHSPRPHDVAQTFHKRTWGKINKDQRLEVVCEDPFPPGKTQCEMASTHLIFLETLVEESWMEKELKIQQIQQKYWLGIEKNATDQWNWSNKKLSQHETNPRFKSKPSPLTHAIFDSLRFHPESELKWKQWTEDRRENVICEENIYPKLISELLCYRRAGAVTDFIASYSFWLGLRREDDGNWYWLGQGGSQTLMENDRWVAVESDGAGHAITVEGGEWIQARMTDTFPFICEEEYDNEMVIHYRVCTKFVQDAIPVFNYETRSCYYLFDNITDWKTARETCSLSQTYVVHLDTDKEQSWLVSLVKDFGVHDNVWIGIESRAAGQWSWRFAKHAEVTQNKRFPGSAEGGETNARMLSDGTWERVSRDSLSGLICEESISPLGIQEAERMNVGRIVYVPQNVLEDEETTTSLDTTTLDSTTVDTSAEDTPGDLTTTEPVANPELTPEDLTSPEPTPKDVANPEPSTSTSPFDQHPFVSASPTGDPGFTRTVFTDAISSTDTASRELLRSSEISTYDPHTISSSLTFTLDPMQAKSPNFGSSSTVDPLAITPTPSSEYLTSTHQTTTGDWRGFCPNADSYPGGYVIETPYRKTIVGNHENVSKIATFSRSSNLRCAKQCSSIPDCWFYTRDKFKTCTLYQVLYGGLDSFDCSADVPCYFKACKILYGGS